jgi:hypothetical protein
MAWFFFTEGFVSIVGDRNDADNLLVRARTEPHLLAFLGRDLLDELGRDIIRTTPAGDYLYRAFIPRSFAVQRVEELTMGIDYDNFKNTLDDHDYHDAAFEVWSAMHKLQERTRSKAEATVANRVRRRRQRAAARTSYIPF